MQFEELRTIQCVCAYERPFIDLSIVKRYLKCDQENRNFDLVTKTMHRSSSKIKILILLVAFSGIF